MSKTNEREWEVKHAVMFDRIAPMTAKLRAKYPKEMNIDGFEPALTSDVAEICLQLELDVIAKRDEQIKNRIENVFASKYEGLERINIKHEYAVMSCFDDRNYEAITSLNKTI